MGTCIHAGKTMLLLLVLCLAHSGSIGGVAPPTAFVGQIKKASLSSSKYVTTISLGTPPQLVLLTLDTAAEVTSISSTSSFKPSKSSTYRLLPGKLSSDTTTLNSTDGYVPTAPLKLNGIRFKLLSRRKDVLALGAGALAFPAQVSAAGRVVKKFAYCLAGYTAPTPIFFGHTNYFFDSGLPPQGNRYPEFNITPLLKYTSLNTPTHGKGGYTLQISSIVVDEEAGGRAVKVSDVATIGTGALYTRIVEPAYTQIRQAFLRVPAVTGFPRVKSHHGPLDLCFNLTGGLFQAAPIITFTFGGNSSVAVTANNYLVEVGSSNIYCFGFISAGTEKGSSMIGTFQQQDNLVEFDLEKKRVGITGSLIGVRSNCGNFNFTGA